MIGRPRKTKRNAELMKLRNEGWGYRKLAAQFGLDYSTVKEIILREEKSAKNDTPDSINIDV
jgi:lambda repressor-like predicted transcriptional regulator